MKTRLSLLLVCFHILSKAQVPTPDHVVIVILENHAYGQIIGSSNAPYINSLANDSYGAVFTQSYAITHPSQPNYLYLFSGLSQNVVSDDVPSALPFTSQNLGASLLQKGKSFTGFSEDLPYAGFSGDHSGQYQRKHNPSVNWQDGNINGIPASRNQPMTSFPSDYNALPTLCFVIPNQDNDMHDGTIATADTWLKDKLDGYVKWARSNNSLLIITFDEDNGTDNNRIPTIFCGQMVKHGQYNDRIDHNSVLRTLEAMYGLPYAGSSATSTTITNCWNEAKPKASLTASATIICENESVSFFDQSANKPTAWHWSFPGGNPSESSAQNPVVTYPAPGDYNVTLTTSNQAGSDTNLKTNYIKVNPKPAISLIANASSICAGDVTMITAVGADSYHWISTPGIIFNSGNSITASPIATAVYQATGKNVFGCTSELKNVTITVHELPSVAITSTTKTICLGNAVTLNAKGAATYRWLPTNGLDTDEGATVKAHPSGTSTYTVTGTNDFGCTNIATVKIAVSTMDPPKLSVSGAVLSSTSAAAYQWHMNGKPISGATSQTFEAFDNGDYHIEAFNSDGCSNVSDVLTLTLNVKPVSVLAASRTKVCAGGTITFADESLNAPTSRNWIIQGGSPATSTAKNPVVTFKTAGTYDVKLITSNRAGSDTMVMKNYITTYPTPVISVAADRSAICKGDTLTITASGAETYQWTPAKGIISAQDNRLTVAPESATVFNATGKNIFGCVSKVNHVTVSVNDLPNITVSTKKQTICEGNSIMLNVQGAKSFRWSPSTGLNADTGESVVASPLTSTTYSVTGTDKNGCVNKAIIRVEVNSVAQPMVSMMDSLLKSTTADAYQWYFNGQPIDGATAQSYVTDEFGTFSVESFNAEGCSQMSPMIIRTLPTGINQPYVASHFSVYPNPASNQITVSMRGDAHSEYFFELRNSLGQLVYQSIVDATITDQFSINIEGFRSGIYFMSMTTGGKREMARVVVY